MPGSNPNANPFTAAQAPGSNPAANPFAVPGSNPAANPFAIGQAPGSNPSANPFPAQPYGIPPSGPVSLPRPQYDMSRMAAREELIRRLVWIAVLVVATTIGVVILAR